MVSHNIPWSGIPGYPVLLKAMLLELKEREIKKYPDSLISASCSMLHNSKILNVLVKILFEKTNVHEMQTVQETYKFLNTLFITLHKYKKKIPSNFDTIFFVTGIKMTIESDVGINVAKCLEFLYNNYHMFKDSLRKELIVDFLVKRQFRRLFFH